MLALKACAIHIAKHTRVIFTKRIYDINIAEINLRQGLACGPGQPQTHDPLASFPRVLDDGLLVHSTILAVTKN